MQRSAFDPKGASARENTEEKKGAVPALLTYTAMLDKSRQPAGTQNPSGQLFAGVAVELQLLLAHGTVGKDDGERSSTRRTIPQRVDRNVYFVTRF